MVEQERFDAVVKEMLRFRKESREYKKSLRALVEATQTFITNLDALMKEPSAVDRGRKIALLSNQLDYAKDIAKHFGLGIPFKDKSLNPKQQITEGKARCQK